VDLDALTDRFDRPETTGVDEYLFPSLHAAGVLLGLPGGFTGEGVRKRLRAPFITR
jgi:hypothetical protein